MTKSAVIWSTALIVSLTAHMAAAAVLFWVTLPDDVPDQQPPETELQLAAFQVQRSEAQETRPDAQNLATADTGGTRVDQNAIATSQSKAQTVASERLSAAPDTGQAVAVEPLPNEITQPATGSVTSIDASAPSAREVMAEVAAQDRIEILATPTLDAASLTPIATLASAVANTVPTQSAQRATGQPLASVVTAALSVSQTTPRSETATAPELKSETGSSVQPDSPPPPASALSATAAAETETPAQLADALALSAPAAAESETPARQADALALSAPAAAKSETPARQAASMALSAPAAAESETPAQQAAALAPPATRSKASLAFTGGGDGPVDPVSLTAFQSLMAPDDLGAQAAEVRDGISSALSAVPCSRVQMRYDPDANTVILTGHVPEADLRSSVLAMMQEQMGADIPVREDLLVLPRPQCGALTGIAQVGLPQSTDQITNPLLLGQSTHASEFVYVDGQALVLDLQGADYDAYVYVDFFDAGGNVLHLMPNEFSPMQATPAKSELKIGSERPLSPGEPGLYIKIGPPYGQEIAVAFAASEPLYEGVRPLVEPAEPYLDWLRERVSDARSRNSGFKGEWVYFFVSTADE